MGNIPYFGGKDLDTSPKVDPVLQTKGMNVYNDLQKIDHNFRQKISLTKKEVPIESLCLSLLQGRVGKIF